MWSLPGVSAEAVSEYLSRLLFAPKTDRHEFSGDRSSLYYLCTPYVLVYFEKVLSAHSVNWCGRSTSAAPQRGARGYPCGRINRVPMYRQRGARLLGRFCSAGYRHFGTEKSRICTYLCRCALSVLKRSVRTVAVDWLLEYATPTKGPVNKYTAMRLHCRRRMRRGTAKPRFYSACSIPWVAHSAGAQDI
jgi:hypothetical protein